MAKAITSPPSKVEECCNIFKIGICLSKKSTEFCKAGIVSTKYPWSCVKLSQKMCEAAPIKIDIVTTNQFILKCSFQSNCLKVENRDFKNVGKLSNSLSRTML